MGRSPCCNGDHTGLKKGPWTHEEDLKLKSFILNHPTTTWRLVPLKAGLVRCGKSCQLRWMNYLRPDIRRGNFTREEEDLIVQLHDAVGNRWSTIASQLPGRTDNEIKNLWNTKLRRVLVDRGINPTTHQPFYNPQLSHGVTTWIKSIESTILADLTMQTTLPTTTNTNSGRSSSSKGRTTDILSYGLHSFPWAMLPSPTMTMPTTSKGFDVPLPLHLKTTGRPPMSSGPIIDQGGSQASESSFNNVMLAQDVLSSNDHLGSEFGDYCTNGWSFITQNVSTLQGSAAGGFGSFMG